MSEIKDKLITAENLKNAYDDHKMAITELKGDLIDLNNEVFTIKKTTEEHYEDVSINLEESKLAIAENVGDKVSIIDMNNRRTAKITVSPNQKYKILCSTGNSYYFNGYILTDSNNNCIEYNYDANITGIKHEYVELTVPDGCEYLYVNGQGGTIPTVSLIKSSEVITKEPSLFHKNIGSENKGRFLTVDENGNVVATELESSNESILNGKTINILGDSISSTDYELPSWYQIVEERTGCKFNDYAWSGTSISHVDSRHLNLAHGETTTAESIGYDSSDPSTWNTGGCMCERYDRMTVQSVDAVIVFGGSNDIGVMRGAWDSTDTTTLFGALNVLLKGLIQKYPNKPIIFFTPIQRQNEYSNGVINPLSLLDAAGDNGCMSTQLRATAIKQKCDQYAIKCVDLYSCSGISGLAGNLRDGLHPNANGQIRLANIIQHEIESVIS